MSITPGGVHDEDTRIRTNGFGEGLGTFLDNDVTPTKLAGEGCIQRRPFGVFAALEFGNNNLVLETRFSLLTFDGAAVDSEVSEVGEQFLCTVLALDELEKLGSIIDELRNVLMTS